MKKGDKSFISCFCISAYLQCTDQEFTAEVNEDSIETKVLYLSIHSIEGFYCAQGDEHEYLKKKKSMVKANDFLLFNHG